MSIRIFLADDHQIVLDGLRALLAQQPDMEVVGTAADGREALEKVKPLRPDVVVLDIGMPNLNGIEAARQLRDQHPELKIIGLSMHANRGFVRKMIQAGAMGYVLKNSAVDELVRAILQVLNGQYYLSPRLADLLVREYTQHLAQVPETEALTNREREILQLLVEGHSRKEIAAHLYISHKTVAAHCQHIMDKLDLHSLPELTKYALREGLTSLEY